MPVLVDILEATPRCRRHRMRRRGQHGVHFTCHEPMRYEADGHQWRCSGCGWETPAEQLAAERLAAEAAELPRAA